MSDCKTAPIEQWMRDFVNFMADVGEHADMLYQLQRHYANRGVPPNAPDVRTVMAYELGVEDGRAAPVECKCIYTRASVQSEESVDTSKCPTHGNYANRAAPDEVAAGICIHCGGCVLGCDDRECQAHICKCAKRLFQLDAIQAESAQLREALGKIADPANPGIATMCECDDHTSPDCCTGVVNYYCPQCIAGKALSSAASTQWLEGVKEAARREAFLKLADSVWIDEKFPDMLGYHMEGVEAWLRAQAGYQQPDCLCVHATPNFDGVHHDRRCKLYAGDPQPKSEGK